MLRSPFIAFPLLGRLVAWLPRLLIVCASILAPATGHAAIGDITTVAGGGNPGDGVPATQVDLNPAPTFLAVDGPGNVYFVQGGLIRRVSAAGVVSTVAGTGGTGFAGDGGPAYSARFDGPAGLAVDGVGNLFVCDERNNRVRRIDAAGVITTVANLTGPRGVAVDALGNLLVSAGTDVFRVVSGAATRVAGNGTPGDSGDGGPATSAQLRSPEGIVLDGAGGFLVADSSAGRIRRVDSTGIITTFAGKPFAIGVPRGVPGPAVDAVITGAQTLARDAAGNVFIGFYVGNQVFVVNGAGNIAVAAGTGGFGFSGDGGPATSAQLAGSNFVAVDSAGSLYISDVAIARRIRKVDASGIIRTYAGGGSSSSNGDGGSAIAATLTSPVDVAVKTSGDIFISDPMAGRVRRVDAAGVISTFAGNGTVGAGPWTVGGPATMASLQPYGVAVDADGNVFFLSNDRVYKVDAAGNLSIAAGGGASNADGVPATSAFLSNTAYLVLDTSGNLYVTSNYRVRRIDRFGFIWTVAGTGSIATSPRHGEGGPAIIANINPTGLVTDAAGSLFISDHPGQVRKVDGAGIITTIAGTGTAGFSGDGGPAVSAQLSAPAGLAFDDAGNLYIADRDNHRIRVVSWQGTISTLAGDGVAGFGGDGGPASVASVQSPTDVFWDPAGYLLIADRGNNRVRRVELADTFPAAFAFPAASNVALSATVQSASLTPSDFAAAARVMVSGGEYSIGCTATFVSVPGTIDPGQSVCVRHTSAGVNNMDVVTTLTIGGRAGTFTSTTLAGPGSTAVAPASIDFGAQSMNTTAPAQSVTISNTGGVSITVNNVSASGDFAVTHGCGTLAPAATCMANVTFTPLSQGTLAGTLTLQSSPGTQTVSLSGFGERSLTVHYYRSILRRAPDVQGKNFWEGEATRLTGLGVSINEIWYAMAMSFFFSPEYVAFNRSDAEFMADLYNTFFNRPPDPSGSAYWGSQLASGMPREVVLASFLFSPEFGGFTRAIFGNTAARAEVDVVMDFYRGLLARLPENEGLTYWVGRFRAAQCAGGGAAAVGTAIRNEVEAISKEFATGADYANRNRTNSQYVGDLYNSFLRRGGDLAGVQFFINELNANARTREKARTDFLASAEFQGRVLGMINAGCLP